MAQGVARITGSPSSVKSTVCNFTDAESYNRYMLEDWERSRSRSTGIVSRPTALSEAEFREYKRKSCATAPTRRRELEHVGAMTEQQVAEYQKMLVELEEAEKVEQAEQAAKGEPVTPSGASIKNGRPTILSAAEAKEKIRKYRGKVGRAKVGAGDVGAGDVGAEEVGAGDVGAGDVGTGELSEDQRCVAAGNFWENGVCVQKRAQDAPKALTLFEQYKTPIYVAMTAGAALLLWSIFKKPVSKSKKKRR